MTGRRQGREGGTGSKEDREQADAIWTLLRGLTEVATRRCAEAGYPLRPDRLEEAAPIAPGFVESPQKPA